MTETLALFDAAGQQLGKLAGVEPHGDDTEDRAEPAVVLQKIETAGRDRCLSKMLESATREALNATKSADQQSMLGQITDIGQQAVLDIGIDTENLDQVACPAGIHQRQRRQYFALQGAIE